MTAPDEIALPGEVGLPTDANVDVAADTPLAAALGYAERGWRVHPLRASGSDKNRKLPRLKGWQNVATTDRDQIHELWNETPHSGVGIATGNGLFVLDLDNKNSKSGDAALAALIEQHGQLPDTLTVATPSGGRHYYFSSDGQIRNSESKVGEGLDIRGAGGYVVAPSPAGAGCNYRWQRNGPVAPAPMWLVNAAIAANSKTAGLTKEPAPGTGQSQALPEGSRNSELFREGARMRRVGATEQEIAAHLHQIPVQGELDPGEIAGIAASAARYAPRAWGAANDPCTELANAYRIVSHFGDQVLYVEGIGWHVWIDGVGPWRRDELAARRFAHQLGMIVSNEACALAEWVAAATDDDVRAFRKKKMDRMFQWVTRSESAQVLESTLKMAQAMLSCRADQMDAAPMLLGTPSGVLELDTGTYRKHRQGDRLTRVTGCDFDPAATAPTWRKFLTEIFCGDAALEDYVQRIIAYALSGHRGEHLLPIFHGAGANGKSTFLGAVQWVFGDYSGTAAPGLLITKNGNEHPTGLADLQGRRLVVVSETGEAGRLNEEQVKALTGGDRISARRMRMDFYQFDPTHLLIMQTNHKPKVSGTDEGIWRRLRLIPFAATIPVDKRDPRLPDKLRAELPGILAWAVEGWRKYQADGFCTPAVVTTATNVYRDSSDQVGTFIAEACDVAGWLTSNATDLYRAYCAWCDSAGERARPQRELGVRLAERGFEAGKGTGGVRRWRGLAVASTAGSSGGSGASGAGLRLNHKGPAS